MRKLNAEAWLKFVLLFCTAWTANCTAPRAGETAAPVKPAAKVEPQKISEEELQRVNVRPAAIFPWSGKPLPPKPQRAQSQASKSGAPAAESPVDLNSDLVMKFNGPFIREEKSDGPPGSPPNKEWMTLNKDVEIEMIQTQSVLRGQTVIVVRDIKTGDTEALDAKGGVQVVSPERIGRGEMVRFEMQTGADGVLTKNTFLLVGDLQKKKKATLWLVKDPANPSKKDVMQAYRFTRDEIADTFRASGAPSAVLTLDPPAPVPGAAPKTPGAPKASGQSAGLGGMDLNGGGKISMNCENEMNFDGATGKLKLTHNAVLVKESEVAGEGVKMSGDYAEITMSVPPPGQPAAAAGGFSGDMQMLECKGRVEIKTGSRTILCDNMRYDLQKNLVYMNMTNPGDTVNVWNQSLPDGGEVMIAPRSLVMNTETQELEAGGPMKTKSFTGPSPSNRGNGPTQEDVLKQQPPVDAKAKGVGLFGAPPAPAKK